MFSSNTTIPGKTGGWGAQWIILETPRPHPVDDRYRYWGSSPPRPSERCEYWLRQIQRGWRPNRRLQAMDYDDSARWYGVYIYEYLHVIAPELTRVFRSTAGEHR